MGFAAGSTLGSKAATRFSISRSQSPICSRYVRYNEPLFQRQHMLGPPVALQRFPDGLLAGLDAWIPQLRQHHRIPLPGYDGIQNRQPCQARDVTDDMLDLHVHLRQRLLHMLHVLAGHLDQIVAVPHERTYRAHIPLRPERRMQQTHRVQMLNPLASTPRPAASLCLPSTCRMNSMRA
jgi:hypothetical protein